LCLAVAHSQAPTACGSILLGLGSGVLYPGFSHAILDRAPEWAKGRALGFYFTAQFAGPFLSTALIVPAITTFGRQLTLLAISGVLLVGWIAFLSRANPAGPTHTQLSRARTDSKG
jgi:MFS family permease